MNAVQNDVKYCYTKSYFILFVLYTNTTSIIVNDVKILDD